jgi:hypothetical protein
MKAKQAINKNYFLVIALLSFFLFKNIEFNAQAAYACLYQKLDALFAASSSSPIIFL